MNHSALRINSDRLNRSLADLAAIGATPGGGVTRLTLSNEDRQARQVLVSALGDLGLTVNVDDLGNIWAMRPGRKSGSPVLLGSHIDTVVQGGKFDGALGVMGALEVLRTLVENDIETELPIGLVNWTNEEGVRFEPALLAAGAIAGQFTTEYVHNRTDRSGLRFEDELQRIGFAGAITNRPNPAAYLELHIEQGPVLESLDRPVGVVDGIVGVTWIDVIVSGQADHAGPSPMHLRRDPLMAASELILAVEHIALGTDETAVGTVGRVAVTSNVINTIPGRVQFSVDFRHRDAGTIETEVAQLRDRAAEIAARRSVEIVIDRFWSIEPTSFAPDIVSAIGAATVELDLPVQHLWSGAAHDAKYIAEICPTGMIFVRSRDGLSHCEAEFSTPEDIAAGVNILLHAALAVAGSRT